MYGRSIPSTCFRSSTNWGGGVPSGSSASTTLPGAWQITREAMVPTPACAAPYLASQTLTIRLAFQLLP
jgi:hypothetical protein